MSFYDNTLFNGVDLNTLPYFEVDSILPDTAPDMIISSSKLVRNDGMKLYNREYGGRSITLIGHFSAPDRSTYHSSRDTLLRYLQPQEATLRLPINNDSREYTATVQETIFSDVGGGYGAVTINFFCADPFGYDVNLRTVVNGTTTTSATNTFSLSETVGGSYSALPFITITVASISGGTGKYIDVANEDGDNIRITRDWVLNDVLTLDMKLKQAKVNGTLVDYTGTFWGFSVGDTGFDYEDNFTTRTIGMQVLYKRRYL